jgi:hypothetical protein
MVKCDGYENNCDCPKCAWKWVVELIKEVETLEANSSRKQDANKDAPQ